MRAGAAAVNAYDRGMSPLYIDEHMLVFEKPSGLLSVPGRTQPDCLSARAQAIWPDALVVHRLDMDTSGLLVMARGIESQRRLGLAFERRRVHKVYLAVVEGRPAEDSGSVDLPLIVDWPNRPRQKVDHEHGRRALTHWRVLERGADRSTMELLPVTGRSHQLRVHMMTLGHPIVGDELYGTAGERLLLHAAKLELPHPDDGRMMQFESAPPFATRLASIG